MRKTAIKLTMLCMILLVSISGIVLGATNNVTVVSSANGTSVDMNTTDSAATPTVADTDTANVSATTDTEGGQAAIAPTQEGVVNPVSPQDTVVPTASAQIPKSPGFGSVVAIAVLLFAMYISKRK